MDKKSIEDRLNTFRLKGIDESDHARWDGNTCERSFRTYHDMYFQDHEDEEDDDWPEFVGEDMVRKSAKAHFEGYPVNVSVTDDEKHWFRVIVEVIEQKNTVKTVADTAKQKENTMSTSTGTKSLKDEVIDALRKREENFEKEAISLVEQIMENKQKIIDSASNGRSSLSIKAKLKFTDRKEFERIGNSSGASEIKCFMKKNGLDGFIIDFHKDQSSVDGVEIILSLPSLPKKKE